MFERDLFLLEGLLKVEAFELEVDDEMTAEEFADVDITAVGFVVGVAAGDVEREFVCEFVACIAEDPEVIGEVLKLKEVSVSDAECGKFKGNEYSGGTFKVTLFDEVSKSYDVEDGCAVEGPLIVPLCEASEFSSGFLIIKPILLAAFEAFDLVSEILFDLAIDGC